MPVGVSKGYYGALTVKAVKAYQKSLGLDQLGIVGPATRKALNAAQ
jgi:peptidoglycan hydrolase-like protein with peptidoglycan-binding domain